MMPRTRNPRPTLVDVLCKAYPDRCPKGQGVAIGRCLHIDMRHPGHKDYLICHVEITPLGGDPDRFRLELVNAGFAERIRDLVESWDGTVRGDVVRIELSIGQYQLIEQLAQRIKRLTSKGCSSYSDSNWKWIVPRVVEALRTFAKNIRPIGKRVRAEGGQLESKEENSYA